MKRIGTIPPDKQKYVLGIVLGFSGILMQGKDAGIFDGDLDTNKATKFLVSIALSVVPLYGAEGGTVGELIISYVGNDGIKQDFPHVSGNFEVM